MAKRAFGELEAQILYILKSNKRLTVKDVHRALGGKDNYNTVMTVMNRLAEKKMVARERVGLQYEYWVLEGSKKISIFETFKQKLFGIKTSAMVSYLIESAEDLTDEEVSEMEKLLHKIKLERKKQS